MIFQPVSLSPKNLSVDGNSIQTFTWKSTGAPQTDYQVIIRNNSDDSLVYNSFKIQSTISSHTIPKNTMINGNDYKWQVQVWNNGDSAISDWVFVAANTTPVITFTDPNFLDPIYIDSQEYTFKVNYAQAESIIVKMYRFILWDQNGTVILYDSDWIYGISLEHKISGMLRDTTYKIECQAYSQNDLFATTGKKSFVISEYILPEGTPELDINVLDDVGAVEIKWNTQVAVAEVTDDQGNPQNAVFTTGKFGKGLSLGSNQELTYTKPVTTDYTLSFYIKLAYGHDGDFVEFDNGIIMGYDATLKKFYLNDNDVYLYSNEVSLYTWEDFTGIWSSYTGTWMNPGFNPSTLTYKFLFVAMTEDGFIIKIDGTKVAESEEE